MKKQIKEELNNNKKIIVICTKNSCRSQMAEGFFKDIIEKNKLNNIEIYSAGLESSQVHPLAIQVMKELNIDISHHISKKITDLGNIQFDYIITVCDHANENCPYIPCNAKRLHHNFSDPAKFPDIDPQKKLNEFRKIRDEIQQFCYQFIKENILLS